MGKETQEDFLIYYLQAAVQYRLGKPPFNIQTYITHLLYNMYEDNFNQNYGRRFDFNPFDTKPMAKIAVKMSIMRVVKFMSS